MRRAVAIGLLACCLLSARAADPFLVREVSSGAASYPYAVYLPEGYDPAAGRKWPVILFLHGIGDRGHDGRRQTRVGLGRAIRENPSRFPFIVVMPQCPKGRFWTDDAMMAQALAALDRSVEEFGGDPAREYLTGLSMGGYGVWYFATRNPGRFAALAPICGGIAFPGTRPAVGEDPYTRAARDVGATPVWIFHGSDDPRVPVTESRRMTEAIRKAGGSVRYTEYPGVRHNAWDRAYAEPGLPEWFLSSRLGR
ncbi:MAG TPA: dienelactone hydrolase family protein [Patescibacteria group bacterium]|nr:dienelactone hydrolase family protein [Patescibacteria group bacterium]